MLCLDLSSYLPCKFCLQTTFITMCITFLDIYLYVVKKYLSPFKLSFSFKGGGVTFYTNRLGSERSVKFSENDL